ncbi:MAG: hypothetical protein ACK55I_27880, partial [bacterium]
VQQAELVGRHERDLRVQSLGRVALDQREATRAVRLGHADQEPARRAAEVDLDHHAGARVGELALDAPLATQGQLLRAHQADRTARGRRIGRAATGAAGAATRAAAGVGSATGAAAGVATRG